MKTRFVSILSWLFLATGGFAVYPVHAQQESDQKEVQQTQDKKQVADDKTETKSGEDVDQEQDEKAEPKPQQAKKKPEFTEYFDKMFLSRAPKIGELAPEVGAFDEDGYMFDLPDTRGKYTVIVFGCMT